ncbi:MAG TPA: high-affinity branched-chain amino acid ABC transporter permease LivM [Burkholderiales bacterium]|nr:high-affinity branched-chain amino acid ABC transporter permease LivM [Burkholderiales bacterium]
MDAAARSKPPFDVAGALKDAGKVAAVTVLLTLALVGFHTQDTSLGPPLEFRFDDVAAAALIAFAGRLCIVALGARRALPVLVAALAFALAWTGILAAGVDETLLPFKSTVLNGTLAVAGWLLAARAGWAVWHGASDAGREAREARMDRLGAQVQKWAWWAGPLLLGFAVALPFFPWTDRRLLDVATLVVTYIMLGWGLNIVVGLAGLLDLGYVAFYAVGAYSYALLALHFDLGFWICLPFAGIMAAFAGILLGFPVLRLRGDYLAIVTLGFGEIIRVILLNWYQFTKGPDGLSGIPRPTFFGLPIAREAADGGPTFHSFFGLEYSPTDRLIFLYYLALGLALVTNLFTLRIRKLPVGRAWEALREDEIACKSLGVHPRNTKLTAFAIGAMFGGFGGSFFATRQGFISPESFTFLESAIILAIVVLGGMGSQIGIVLAALLLIGLPELFRELNQYRMLAFGLAMVAIMTWRPRGLLAHREPTVRLPVRRPNDA